MGSASDDAGSAPPTEVSELDEPIERTEVEVFPIELTPARAPDAAGRVHDRSPTLAERLRHGGDAVREGIDHALEYHARPGPRPGAVPRVGTTSSRAGGGTDIVRPVRIDPATACQLALSGALFGEPIPHLHVEQPGDDRCLTWGATLTYRHRRHRATLHLMASPSQVVTVIELVPRRRIRHGRQRWVDEGVAAVEELAHRLERAVSLSPVAGAAGRRGRPTTAGSTS